MSKAIFILGAKCKSGDRLLNRRFLHYHFSFVVQFSFTDVCAVTHVHFAGSRILAKGHFFCLVMCSSLCTPLLGMSSFGIRHNLILCLSVKNYLSRSLNFSSPFHSGLEFFLTPLPRFSSIASTSLLQDGPPISSGPHIRCIGMARLTNS